MYDSQEHINNEVITLQTAAKILCLSYSSVLRLVTSGELAGFRATPKAWRTTTSACLQYIRYKLGEQSTSSEISGDSYE